MSAADAVPVVHLERPRLFVPAKRLPALQALARGQLSEIYLERVRKDCDRVYDEARVQASLANPNYLFVRTLALLTCFRVEGDRAYMEKAMLLARRIIQAGDGKTPRDWRVRIQCLAILYDWLHDALPAAERQGIRADLAARYERHRPALNTKDEFVSGYNHWTTASLLIAAISLCDGTGTYEKELAHVHKQWQEIIDVARYVAADGGHHLGWDYGRSYAARLAWVSEALTTATSADVFEEERPWLSQLGYHFVYGQRPDKTFFRVGDSTRSIHVNVARDVQCLGLLSRRYQDPHLAWFAAQAMDVSYKNRSLAKDPDFVFALWFFDPLLPRSAPDTLPLVRAFPRVGNYTMRTGWGADDTAVLFRAMPWYHFNHEHRDFGSFLIYHRGGLAIHGSAYHAGDTASHYGGSHLSNYAWRTVAHNTVTVFDPDERFCSPTGSGRALCTGKHRWSNDGGHQIRSKTDGDSPVPHFQPRNVRDIQDPRFAQGRVPAYEDQSTFTYILADGTQAYRRDKVELFERHFFFLKKVEGWRQPVIVVFDRVIARRPEFKKAWNLHTVDVPRLEGHVYTTENKTHVRLSGNPPEHPGDVWYQYSGKLYCETLLPESARVEFIGGAGKEFWVNGENYPAGIRDIDRVLEPGLGRIQVTPSVARKTDLFLHVLSPASVTDKTPRPEARRVETDADAALRVANHVLVFLKRDEASASRYSLSHEAALEHIVSGVTASKTYSISHNGKRLANQVSSSAGVLTFSTRTGGTFALEGADR